MNTNTATATAEQPKEQSKPRNRDNEQRAAHDAIVRSGKSAIVVLGKNVRDVLQLGWGLVAEGDTETGFSLMSGFEVETHEDHFDIVALAGRNEAETKMRATALINLYKRIRGYRKDEHSAKDLKFTITPCVPLPEEPVLSADKTEIAYTFAVQGGVPHVVGYKEGRAYFFSGASFKVMQVTMNVQFRQVVKIEVHHMYFMTDGEEGNNGQISLRFSSHPQTYSKSKAEELGNPDLAGEPMVEVYYEEDSVIQDQPGGRRPIIHAGYFERRLTEMENAIPQGSEDAAEEMLGQSLGSMFKPV